MRLRQLGHGQSVKFFAPEVVDRQICELRARHSSPLQEAIGAFDVLQWVIAETCTDLLHNAPHWLKQGIGYNNRRAAWDAFNSRCNNGFTPNVEELKTYWMQPEARSLSEMYWPDWTDGAEPTEPTHPDADMTAVVQRYRDLGFMTTAAVNARLEEEQEREVDVEVEREVIVERPPRTTPAKHSLDQDIVRMVRCGTIPTASGSLFPVFEAVGSLISSLSEKQRARWTHDILATRDFMTTVEGSEFGGDGTQFLRPLNWVLSFPEDANGRVVLLSPFEINELLPVIQKSKRVRLHIYAPRVMQNCQSFEDLRFYTIHPLPSSWKPPRSDLIIQLNILAGQLYIRDFATYQDILDFLGLFSRSVSSSEAVPDEIQSDGFVLPIHRQGRMAITSPFVLSPVPFVKSLMDTRRKGMSYLPTHIGRILNAAPLAETDFDW